MATVTEETQLDCLYNDKKLKRSYFRTWYSSFRHYFHVYIYKFYLTMYSSPQQLGVGSILLLVGGLIRLPLGVETGIQSQGECHEAGSYQKTEHLQEEGQEVVI